MFPNGARNHRKHCPLGYYCDNIWVSTAIHFSSRFWRAALWCWRSYVTWSGADQPSFGMHAAGILYLLQIKNNSASLVFCNLGDQWMYFPRRFSQETLHHHFNSSCLVMRNCFENLLLCSYHHVFCSKHFICGVFHCCSLRCNSCNAVVSALQLKVNFKRFPLLKRSPGASRCEAPPQQQPRKSQKHRKTFNWMNLL